MKQILRNKNIADISKMPASYVQVTHFLGRNVVYQIVSDHKVQFTVITTSKSLRYALVICGVYGQLLKRRNGGLLSVAKDYAPTEFTLSAEVVEIL